MDASEKTLLDLVRAISLESTVELEFYFSWNPFEKNTVKCAENRFARTRADAHEADESIFVYLNFWSQSYCILISPRVQSKLDPMYWKELQKLLGLDLQGTHYRNALALLAQTLRPTLAQHFPPIAHT